MTERHNVGLQGRVAVVTGSSAGVGRAIARDLASCGAAVVVNGRRRAPVDAVVRELEQGGSRATAIVADVTTPDGVARLIDGTIDRLGRLDVLVNNVGGGTGSAPARLVPRDAWERTLALNLAAPFFCAQAAHPHLVASRGVVINIGSIAGEVALPQRAPYGAAKAGLRGLTRSLAAEWGPEGVRVVAVNLGFIATDKTNEAVASGRFDLAALLRRTPLGRLGRPEEVAAAVSFLASDYATFITGATIDVDGGWVAFGGW